MTARAVMGRGSCWRCTQPSVDPNEGPQVVLVHDPMMPPNDRVFICVNCATVRDAVKAQRDRH